MKLNQRYRGGEDKECNHGQRGDSAEQTAKRIGQKRAQMLRAPSLHRAHDHKKQEQQQQKCKRGSKIIRISIPVSFCCVWIKNRAANQAHGREACGLLPADPTLVQFHARCLLELVKSLGSAVFLCRTRMICGSFAYVFGATGARNGTP